jgi:hypothetical protein
MTILGFQSASRIAVCACLCGLITSVVQGAVDSVEARRGAGCTHDIECDDGLACTIDLCDFPPSGPVGAGVCQHAPVPDGQAGDVGGAECAAQFGLLCGGCDDGVFCNGAETCQGGVCAAGTPPCSGGQVCSESLDLCQPGPCSAQKTCVGGPTPGMNCTSNNGCGNGGFCRFADCEDGLHCNGEETCVAGVCQAGENPCGSGALCGEKQCSVGGTIDFCITDEDCAAGLGVCSLLGPVCKTGICCRTSGGTPPGTPGEPTCERRLKKGICLGSTPGTNSGSACSANSQCHGTGCAQTAASCDGVGGSFRGGDYGNIPSGGGVVCPVINDIAIKCPKYSSGIAPFGQIVGFVGAVSNSTVVYPAAGTPINKLGDDYRLSNYGICVGGTRNGFGCGGNVDCPSGGTCNLSGQSVMAVNFLRVFGGLFPATRAVVEFRDASDRLVAESYAEHEQLNGVDRFFFDPPVVIPSEGFVVLSVAWEYTPNGGFVWASTDAVDVGFNDPNVLWINDGPVANFLAPNPGLLAFELEGEKVAAPLGACCDSAGASCTDGVLPWACEGDGNHFQGVGTTCPALACDTGACCSPATGACTVDTDANCGAQSGEFQGYGTDCDPDCCVQPTASGADRCEDVAFHNLTLPPVGESSFVTITGDNSAATLQAGESSCYSGSETPPVELGWYEGFSFAGCAMIRVDYCCTDPVKRPAYPVLFNSCPCSVPTESNANPYEFPQADHGRASPHCDDENQWATFGPLSGGQYYIPIQSGVPGSFGAYQLHITVEPCPTAACCLADQCTDGVNQLECDALGGTFLAPPQKAPAVSDCSNAPCATGSCCLGPGECSDVRLGQPVTPAECVEFQGTYHGGVRCQGGSCQANPVESCSVNADCPGNDTCIGNEQQLSAPSPCPICTIEGSTNCQTFDDTLNFTLSDRHLGSDGNVAADDFRPDSGILDRVCIWGFYLDDDPDALLSDCGPSVISDHFRVRVYANDLATARSPGVFVGENAATSQRAILPQTVVHSRLQTNVYGYEIVLDAPIVGLNPGEVYWLEVSNDVSDSHQSCNWYWSQLAPMSNSFSFTGSDSGYSSNSAMPYENAFCLNMNFSPTGLGAIPGGCCTCDQGCLLETLADCANTNGIWDITSTTCSGVICDVTPPNDDCIAGPPIITEGVYNVSNQCATTDGYGPIPSDFGSSQLDFDLWYNFITPSSCNLVVSECRTGLRFDSMLAVYMNCPPGSPTECDKTMCPPCPLTSATSAATLAGVAQDESCSGAIGGAGYWSASEQILRDAEPGECFLLRIGSFPGNRGTAILDIQCENNVSCDPDCFFFPFAGARFIAVGCELFNACSVAPVRGAIRVHLTSLHHVSPPYTGGPSVPFTSFEGQVRWVGPPTQYVESAATPTPFWASKLQCSPHYQDWGSIIEVYVTGPEIVPSSMYQYELLYESCQGIEGSCTNVSPTFTVRTRRWGDIAWPYNPPEATAQPDVGDIAALVSKFRSAAGAPIKARAMLAGVDQLGNVNLAVDFDFTHIAACVDAFRGRPYPYIISACP